MSVRGSESVGGAPPQTAGVITALDASTGRRPNRMIGDFWTPRAAQQALWVATQMTPKKSAELFQRVGNMSPSKSGVDRLRRKC